MTGSVLFWSAAVSTLIGLWFFSNRTFTCLVSLQNVLTLVYFEKSANAFSPHEISELFVIINKKSKIYRVEF